MSCFKQISKDFFSMQTNWEKPNQVKWHTKFNTKSTNINFIKNLLHYSAQAFLLHTSKISRNIYFQ